MNCPASSKQSMTHVPRAGWAGAAGKLVFSAVVMV